MCAPGPTGDVAGCFTIEPIPAKFAGEPNTAWQATQLPEMPAWFISEPPKLAPSTTGAAAIDEPAPTWQVSHEALVGRWSPGRPTIEKFAAGMANDGAADP